MADGYERLREIHENISGSVSIDSTTTTQTPWSERAFYTIFIQSVSADIVSAGAASTKWRITDTNGSVVMADIPADVEGPVVRDLLALGRALKEGEGLVVECDAGASGIVSWEGYRKLTGVGAT